MVEFFTHLNYRWRSVVIDWNSQQGGTATRYARCCWWRSRWEGTRGHFTFCSMMSHTFDIDCTITFYYWFTVDIEERGVEEDTALLVLVERLMTICVLHAIFIPHLIYSQESCLHSSTHAHKTRLCSMAFIYKLQCLCVYCVLRVFILHRYRKLLWIVEQRKWKMAQF